MTKLTYYGHESQSFKAYSHHCGLISRDFKIDSIPFWNQYNRSIEFELKVVFIDYSWLDLKWLNQLITTNKNKVSTDV